jgi:hypothetical protein
MAETVISFVADDGRGYGAALVRPHGAGAVVLGDGEPLALADGSAEVEDSRVRISSGAGSVELALDAQASPIAFEAGEALTASAQPVRVEAHPSEGNPVAASGVVWNAQRRDPADGALLRTAWALLKDRSLLLLVAARGPGADHGEERIGTALLSGGEPRSFAEPLLSTEYDAAGAHTRATLELWPGEEEALATRGAGDRTGGATVTAAGAELAAARFVWRLDGTEGVGGYEILRG